MFFRVGFYLLVFFSVQAMTWTVSNTSDNESTANSLPWAILKAQPGDTIDCMSIAGGTITLTTSLPAITQNTLAITTSAGAPVTIQGNSTNLQAFSVAAGTISINNFIISNCVSAGGNGGSGNPGGGGGVGGGGALYVHNGTKLTIGTIAFNSNQAIGGTGGAGTTAAVAGGGGGGGYAGGAGGSQGGGGGSHSNGGAGNMGAGTSGTFFGGGR